MIKNSIIVLLVLLVISFGFLLLTTYSNAAPSAKEKPVKCDVPCDKRSPSTIPWNIISPAMYPNLG